MTRKAIVYIDGQNFHHQLETVCKLDSRYINFKKFSEDVLAKGKMLENVKYYGAKYPQQRDPYKHGRDAAFFLHLEKTQSVRVIEGKFLVPADRSIPPREKGVDVRLATDLIFDAFHNSYDDAYIISSDTDLVPAIKQIKESSSFRDKKIFNFSFQKLNDFNVCDGVFLIFPNTIKKYHSPKDFPADSTMVNQLKDRFNSKK